jgi:hypothetical protein
MEKDPPHSFVPITRSKNTDVPSVKGIILQKPENPDFELSSWKIRISVFGTE